MLNIIVLYITNNYTALLENNVKYINRKKLSPQRTSKIQARSEPPPSDRQTNFELSRHYFYYCDVIEENNSVNIAVWETEAGNAFKVQ